MSNEPINTPGLSTRELLTALTALRNGDFSVRLAATSAPGTDDAEIARVFNELGEMLSVYGSEVRRVSRELGTEGRFGPQAEVDGVHGEWQTMLVEFNAMAANLTNQIRDFAQVTTAVANGDLAMKISVDAQGEMQEWKQTIHVMIDQLNTFASELTRLSRDIGNEGKLGGQMEVPGTAGTWKDLIANVNHMAANLTVSVRGLRQYCDSATTGDAAPSLTFLKQGQIVSLPTKGEIALLCDLVEKMQARLSSGR